MKLRENKNLYYQRKRKKAKIYYMLRKQKAI